MLTTVFPHIEDKNIESLVKSFLDIIVLAMLNGNPVHGYKIIADLHRTFGVLLSPGVLYPLLYSLEKENFIEVKEVKRKKLYNLTPKGRRRVVTVNDLYKRNSEKIFHFVDQNLHTIN
jgi:DNA-binding PadR family transcriptional regulator